MSQSGLAVVAKKRPDIVSVLVWTVILGGLGFVFGYVWGLWIQPVVALRYQVNPAYVRFGAASMIAVCVANLFLFDPGFRGVAKVISVLFNFVVILVFVVYSFMAIMTRLGMAP